MKTYSEWFDSAWITIEHRTRYGHWHEAGLARKAALAATGLPDGEGIDVLAETIEAGERIAPNDDPHDAFDVRRMV